MSEWIICLQVTIKSLAIVYIKRDNVYGKIDYIR